MCKRETKVPQGPRSGVTVNCIFKAADVARAICDSRPETLCVWCSSKESYFFLECKSRFFRSKYTARSAMIATDAAYRGAGLLTGFMDGRICAPKLHIKLIRFLPRFRPGVALRSALRILSFQSSAYPRPCRIVSRSDLRFFNFSPLSLGAHSSLFRTLSLQTGIAALSNQCPVVHGLLVHLIHVNSSISLLPSSAADA